jgi:hypothetical protein
VTAQKTDGGYSGDVGDFCRRCGRNEDEVGPISQRGKCQGCALGAVEASITEMRQHSGPYFQRWRHNHAAAVGGIIPEKARPPLTGDA